MKETVQKLSSILEYIVPAFIFTMAYLSDSSNYFVATNENGAVSGALLMVLSIMAFAAVLPAGLVLKYKGLKMGGRTLQIHHILLNGICAFIAAAFFMTNPEQYWTGLIAVAILTAVWLRHLNKYGELDPNRKWYQ